MSPSSSSAFLALATLVSNELNLKNKHLWLPFEISIMNDVVAVSGSALHRKIGVFLKLTKFLFQQSNTAQNLCLISF